MVLKDLDWINSGRKLHLGVDKKRRLLAQIKKDCALLERLEVIDYSMLVGIHRTASARERRTSSYIKVGWVLRLALALSRQLCPAARHTQVGSSARSSCDSVKSSAAGVPLQLGSALAGAAGEAAPRLVPKEEKVAQTVGWGGGAREVFREAGCSRVPALGRLRVRRTGTGTGAGTTCRMWNAAGSAARGGGADP